MRPFRLISRGRDSLRGIRPLDASPGSQTGQFRPSHGFDLGRAGASVCSAIAPRSGQSPLSFCASLPSCSPPLDLIAPSSSVSQPFGSTHRDCMTDPSFSVIDAHIRSSRTQHAQSMPHPSDVSHFCVHNQVHKTWLESLSRETRSRKLMRSIDSVWFHSAHQTIERQRPAMSGACR